MLHMAMEQIKKYMFLVTGVAIGFCVGYHRVKLHAVEQKYIRKKHNAEIQMTAIKHLSKNFSFVDHRHTARQAWHLVQATIQACSNSYTQ